jgi:hypothetical protein
MRRHVSLGRIPAWFDEGDVRQFVLRSLQLGNDVSKLIPRVGSVSGLESCKWTDPKGCSLGADFVSDRLDDFKKETSSILD